MNRSAVFRGLFPFIILIAAIGCGCSEQTKVSEYGQPVDQIEKAGGKAMANEKHRWLRDDAKSKACRRLEELGACIGPIDEAHEHVEILQRADGSKIQDKDIPGIVTDMNTLEDAITLDLSGSEITDRATVYLGQLRTVTALYLTGANLTDAGIPQLAAIPSLEELVLSGTTVTDAGVLKLAAAKKLRLLLLLETKVTNAGVAHLKRALPGLQIEH